MYFALKKKGRAYYPVTAMMEYACKFRIIEKVEKAEETIDSVESGTSAEKNSLLEIQYEARPEYAGIQSATPGDVRSLINLVVFGGGTMWILMLFGIAGLLFRKRSSGKEIQWWALGVGLWAVVSIGYHMREAPDVRFFMAACPFLLLPLSAAAMHVPFKKTWLPLIIAASLVQGGLVLGKTYSLRVVKKGVQEAIDYLSAHPPACNNVFMYPEGNYRLFTCGHNWYLQDDDHESHIKTFWKADNDKRLEMCRSFGLGAIVIKKYLIGVLDEDMSKLGIYPDSFVRDIENDSRFEKVLDNNDVVIYLVPQKAR
jgi:hypothetical protein